MIVVPAKADTHSLKIGVLAPLEGAFGPLGKDAVRGYELALSEHEGRAGERPVEAFVESTDGTPDSVIAKARMLIDRGASILIGPLAGIEDIAIRETAYAHGSGRESLPPDVEVEVRAGERVECSLYVPDDGATT